MRRRLRRSAGHIFSAPEWRVVPPAAHSFLSCQKRMGRKEAPGTRNRADAPEKAFCFCVPFTDRAFRKERPSGGPQNFCRLKNLLRQIFLPVKSKSICSESMRGFQVLPVSARQSLLAAEEKRAKQKRPKVRGSGAKRYSRPQRLFFAYFFLACQKKVCRRRHALCRAKERS